jgi:hypothetical protein
MAILPEVLLRVRVVNSSMMRTRGKEGQDLSLSVPQRLLGEYLQRPVGLEETRAMVTLYQGFEHMEPEEISVGLRGIQEVMQCAEAVESADAIRYCKREVSTSLLKHSVLLTHSRRSLSRSLMGEAVRWDPRLAFTWDMAKQTARLCLPVPARRFFAACKRRVTELS